MKKHHAPGTPSGVLLEAPKLQRLGKFLDEQRLFLNAFQSAADSLPSAGPTSFTGYQELYRDEEILRLLDILEDQVVYKDIGLTGEGSFELSRAARVLELLSKDSRFQGQEHLQLVQSATIVSNGGFRTVNTFPAPLAGTLRELINCSFVPVSVIAGVLKNLFLIAYSISDLGLQSRLMNLDNTLFPGAVPGSMKTVNLQYTKNDPQQETPSSMMRYHDGSQKRSTTPTIPSPAQPVSSITGLLVGAIKNFVVPHTVPEGALPMPEHSRVLVEFVMQWLGADNVMLARLLDLNKYPSFEQLMACLNPSVVDQERIDFVRMLPYVLQNDIAKYFHAQGKFEEKYQVAQRNEAFSDWYMNRRTFFSYVAVKIIVPTAPADLVVLPVTLARQLGCKFELIMYLLWTKLGEIESKIVPVVNEPGKFEMKEAEGRSISLFEKYYAAPMRGIKELIDTLVRIPPQVPDDGTLLAWCHLKGLGPAMPFFFIIADTEDMHSKNDYGREKSLCGLICCWEKKEHNMTEVLSEYSRHVSVSAGFSKLLRSSEAFMCRFFNDWMFDQAHGKHVSSCLQPHNWFNARNTRLTIGE